MFIIYFLIRPADWSTQDGVLVPSLMEFTLNVRSGWALGDFGQRSYDPFFRFSCLLTDIVSYSN